MLGATLRRIVFYKEIEDVVWEILIFILTDYLANHHLDLEFVML